MPDLDALTAAPNHHRLLLENDSVRILDTRIEPGQTVPLHAHPWPAAHYILSPGHFIRRDPNGAITLDTRQPPLNFHQGQALWSDPLPPHTLENVGTTPIHIISIEVKTGAS